MPFFHKLKELLNRRPNVGASGEAKRPVKMRRFSTTDMRRFREMQGIIERAEVRLDVLVKRFEDSGQPEKHQHYNLFSGSREAIRLGLKELPTLPDKEYEERLTTLYALVGQLERQAHLGDDKVQ